jgi:hypothetical protein
MLINTPVKYLANRNPKPSRRVTAGAHHVTAVAIVDISSVSKRQGGIDRRDALRENALAASLRLLDHRFVVMIRSRNPLTDLNQTPMAGADLFHRSAPGILHITRLSLQQEILD